MSSNFDRLKGLTGQAFEDERLRILREYFMTLPEGQAQVAYAMQLKIEDARNMLSPAEF